MKQYYKCQLTSDLPKQEYTLQRVAFRQVLGCFKFESVPPAFQTTEKWASEKTFITKY